MSYFTQCTPEQLRKQYLKLALQYHPDKGGDTSIMQAIQNEYESILKSGFIFKNQHKEGEEWKFSFTEETERKFSDIISKIIHLDIEIEICGSWIWLHKTVKEQRQTYKDLGFYWAPKKKAWSYAEKRSKSRGNYSMSDIRDKFGSQRVTNNTQFVGVN